jgi:RNA polymerase primary sigma factor
MKSVRVTPKITKKESNSFKQYLNDISMITVFTPEEEIECCLKIANGDKKAKEELIRRNLRFVVSIAKKYETPYLLLEDLVNEGNIGLILAADRFEMNSGFKFISYAVYWIRKMIYEYISNTSKMIRVPINKVSSISKFNNKLEKMEQEFSRNIDTFEVLNELEDILPKKEIENFERYVNLKVDSLDVVFNQDDNEGTLYDLISDKSIISPDFNLNQEDIKKQLNTMLNKLKPRDKNILISFFGLNDNVPKTLEQISEEVGLTREMIRQIKDKSIKKLQKIII